MSKSKVIVNSVGSIGLEAMAKSLLKMADRGVKVDKERGRV